MATQTSAPGLDIDLVLKAPGGGTETSTTSPVLDWQLLATGTYTIEVQDPDGTGTYMIGFMNLSVGPFSGAGELDGGAIISGGSTSGTTSGPADLDAYTFFGGLNDRVLIAKTQTGTVEYSVMMLIYPPDGGEYLTWTTSNRMSFQLDMPGTWTLLIADNGYDTSGSYSLSLLNVTSGPHTGGGDLDGSPIVSNQIVDAGFQAAGDFDAYTFFGFAGNRIWLTTVNTGGAIFPITSLFPPGGGSAITPEFLPETGVYTVVLEDNGNDGIGTYTLSLQNLSAGPFTDASDTDGGPITSTDVRNGTISAVGDIDVFTFQGTFGDMVIVEGVATTGGGFNTSLTLYSTDFGTSVSYSGTDRLEYRLNTTGTWTLLMYDDGLNTVGNYAVSLLNVTSGPLTKPGDLDGGSITSNTTTAGQFQTAVDFDAFTFNATAGDHIVVTGVATGAGTHNTALTVYPPGGMYGTGATSLDRLDTRLQHTGIHTIVIEDVGGDNTGAYALSYMNVTSGPLTSGADTDGGPIGSNQVVNGAIGVSDIDAYSFHGTFGQRVLAVAVATAGAGFDTHIRLYGPDWGWGSVDSGTDRLDHRLNATGTWTVVVEDDGDNTAGSYTLSLLNATAGPFSALGEPDGGPIFDNVPRTGMISSKADLDGYTFYGVAGQTAYITASTTSGSLNTQVTLFPPNGGAALLFTWFDLPTPSLPTSGYYTLVLDDEGNDHTGNYTLTVDLMGGATGTGDLPPATLALHAGIPSPFSESTRINFDLPHGDDVRIDVYDVSGRRVHTLVEGNRAAGHHGVTWSGNNTNGDRVASGVYYVRMMTRNETKLQKVVLVR